MANEVILHSAFDPKNIRFSPVSKTSKGGKIVYLSFDANRRIKIQTPVMSAPFGISRFEDASGGATSYSLDGSFRTYDTNPKMGAFLGKCRELDDLLLDVATENSKGWLGKVMPKEVVHEFLRKVVRDPNDPKYAPTLRMKLHADTEIYDENQNRVDINYITKGTTFRAIIDISSVWFVNKNFGISFRISQLAVVDRPASMLGFAFKTEDDEDDGDEIKSEGSV